MLRRTFSLIFICLQDCGFCYSLMCVTVNLYFTYINLTIKIYIFFLSLSPLSEPCFLVMPQASWMQAVPPWWLTFWEIFWEPWRVVMTLRFGQWEPVSSPHLEPMGPQSGNYLANKRGTVQSRGGETPGSQVNVLSLCTCLSGVSQTDH